MLPITTGAGSGSSKRPLKIEILVPGEDFSEKVKELKKTTVLYEEISNKDAVPDAIHKKIGIYYLYLREREEASGILNDYLADHPEDVEALFYRGIIARFSNEPYCDDLKKAEDLGFEITMLLRFTWELREDECDEL